MNRLLLSTVALIAALLGGVAPLHADTVETSANRDNIFKSGVLWQISKPGMEPSYLMGTVHTDDPRIIAVGQRVLPLLASTTTLAVEVLLSSENSAYASRAMFFTDGRHLRQVAGDKLFHASVAALKARGMSEQHVAMMKPWAVFTVLSMPEMKTGQFLDAMLYSKAQSEQKKLIGLETMQEQIAVFDELTMAEQLVLLEDTLAQHGKMKQMIEGIIERYLAQDLVGMEKLNDDHMQFTDAALAEKVNQRLLYQRNLVMFDRMQSLLKQGNVFVAVGVLHLTGERGLLNLLHKAGFELTPVK